MAEIFGDTGSVTSGWIGSRTANSSPPMRAIMSVARSRVLSAAETAWSALSPVLWPCCVDQFEAVEVQHYQRRGLSVAAAAGGLLGDVMLESPPVRAPASASWSAR
jgi:hypothetical protein